VKVLSRVVTAKCSEPQADARNDGGGGSGWKARPTNDRKARLIQRTREILCRKRAAARPIGVTFVMLNQLMRGWINYFGIGSMKGFLKEYGPWMRHKVRVVILKQWKKPRTIYKNLQKLNRIGRCNLILILNKTL
jgi:hypothetical protein